MHYRCFPFHTGGKSDVRGRVRERERTSGPSQNEKVFVFVTYFVSCNRPCAPKEEMAQKRTHS